MFGFGKRKPLTREAFDEVAGDIERRIGAGDYVGASQAAAALRKATEANNGPRTALWADAHFLEARAALALGDYPGALAHMRAAAELEGSDADATKMRLTYVMNVGDMLSELGEFEEAEAVHRAALEERRAFYGEDHPGFGYGAESLGTVLLRRGAYDEAVRVAQSAVAAFREGEEHKLNAALILWMLAEKSRRPESKVLENLDAADRDRLVAAIARAPAYLFIDATVDLRWEVLDHLDDADAQIACLTTIANQSQALGRHDDRIRALQRYVDLTAEFSADDAAYALQGLALACDEAGRHDEAGRAYERALELAGAQRAAVLRNYALYLAERGQDERAETLLREALDTSEGELHARAAGAYGVFLHHRGRFDEAVPRLQTCIEELPPNHPDALTAASHLQFARNGEGCNCALGMPVALSQYVREVIEEYLPAGLIGEVVVTGTDISVSLTRTPSDGEQEAITLAVNEARRRVQALQDA